MINRGFNVTASFIFFLHGCVFAGNQLLVNNVTAALGANETEMGLMISAFYFGQMLLCVFFGELAEHFGKRACAVMTATLVFAGALMLAFSANVPFSIVAFFVFGSGLGAFETTMLALSADNNAGRSNRFLNFTQALFSVGAVISPMVLSALFGDNRFSGAYCGIAVLALVAAMYFVFAKKIDRFAVLDGSSGGLKIFRLVKNPKMLLYMAAIAVFIGAETALTYWIFDYMRFSGAGELGSSALSLYWFSSIFGRLLASRLRSARRLIAPCFALAAVGAALLLVFPSPVLKLICVFVAGVGFGPLYAGISSLAGDLFPENSAAAYALMIFSVNFGGVVFQPVISSFARFSDISYAFVFTSAVTAVAAVLCAVFISRRRA